MKDSGSKALTIPLSLVSAFAFLAGPTALLMPSEAAVISPSAARSVKRPPSRKASRLARPGSRSRKKAVASSRSRNSRSFRSSKKASRASRHKKVAARPAPRPIPPQLYIDKLNVLTLKPGLVHKSYRGALNINVVDVDMNNRGLVVRPYLAGNTFDSLKTVAEHARDSGAIVAVNANYFKNDGTPLGAIKMDGQWVSGSLFNRVAMGITPDRDVKFARVTLHGELKTSNPEVHNIWVNNMNSPRRSGTRLILYNQKWGDSVTLAYDGNLVGVSAQGEVVDTSSRSMRIPYGGYVLTDRKDSDLANLRRGDFVHLRWKTRPTDWNDVEHAVSGGPTLIKNGELFVGLQGEHFKLSWTSSKITRRTACGITKDNHMILATIEGVHNMWDLAKFMQQLGCVDAMNLDGGGSTTMVVNGQTVTRNTSGQRKVAASICVMEPNIAARHVRSPGLRYRPSSDLVSFVRGINVLDYATPMLGMKYVKTQQTELDMMTCTDPEDRPEDFVHDMLSNTFISSGGAAPVVCEQNTGEAVIDINNDIYDPPDSQDLMPKHPKKAEKLDKKQAKLEKKKKADKKQAAPAVPEDQSSGWSKKLLKPFAFGRHKS